MKNTFLIYLNLIVVILSLLSCTNNEPIINTHKTTQSVAIQTAMNELKNHFDTNGALRPDNNLTGNILFDFGFNFEFPITVSYNTGTIVTVNDFKGMAGIVVNMTDTFYINGIVFPFSVNIFNQDTNGVIVQTIADENAFETLINSCNFDDVESECNCNQEFNPVCIEMNTVNGETFTMQFPNMCIAECEDFTQENSVTCNDVVDPRVGIVDCFHFVYPISLVNYDENTITLNSDNELEMAMYTMINSFDFIYPFNVSIEGLTTETISNTQEYLNLLNNCYNTSPCGCSTEYNPVCVEINGEITEFNNLCSAECEGFTLENIICCNPSEDCTINYLTVEMGDCNYDGTYNITIDFETNQPEDSVFVLNFEEYNSTDAVFPISELPITIYNIEVWSQVATFKVSMSNLCSEIIYFDTPICENYGCWTFIFPVTIIADNEPNIVTNQNELNLLMANYPNSSLDFEYPFNVAFDGFNLTIQNNIDFYEIGKWDNICD